MGVGGAVGALRVVEVAEDFGMAECTGATDINLEYRLVGVIESIREDAHVAHFAEGIGGGPFGFMFKDELIVDKHARCVIDIVDRNMIGVLCFERGKVGGGYCGDGVIGMDGGIKLLKIEAVFIPDSFEEILRLPGGE